MIFQAWVRVQTPEYSYWNKLGPAHLTRAEAEAEQEDYVMHKRHGTGGFRKGCPAQTMIKEER